MLLGIARCVRGFIPDRCARMEVAGEVPGLGGHGTRHLELAWHGWEQDEGSGNGRVEWQCGLAASSAACAAVHVWGWARGRS